MSDVTRRSVMAGAATAAAAAMMGEFSWSTRAHAQAPMAGKQAASYYRYKVGDFEVTVVADGVTRFKLPPTFVANVDTAEVKKALAANFYDTEIFNNNYTPIVVNTGKNLVVIDTGTGEAGFNQSKGSNGQFLTNMAAAGIDPKQVDTVIISHFHGDHVNGILKADNTLAFPNAAIRVPGQEYKYWMDDGEMNKQTSERMTGLFKNNRRIFTNPEVAKRVEPYEAGKDIVSGITGVATNGHSVGHHSHIVSSGDKSIFVQGDVTHVPYLFARNPGWHLMFDQDPQMAEATRRKVYDMLAADKMMVQAFHYPFPSAAYIEKTPTGYREHMIQWSPTL
ncbi:MBL fold metallo-hydrolase [Pseudorhodoplanes sinuspersici]|uniref:MBL fold metallo-hydrolase n=1 Tax=Pseudorhodoplanes sinuspersici TaxID=1235591 RepID=A0A1W6ZX31_9HYPH|nr:MBL fold metallo-hydrolase [Pseudorhodoplanes sinuspersici]ARQ01959.1 MBL fold metallo-hydrolase [Pseudorhodoplanes sinuspersici]RKE73733.1 glyoxylase-like metal-dependent hydrolase (beta-lactamase superfamily II) [Pseudorhodoplanes sinuspersici]